jgi:hypothetical protein
VRGPEPRWSRWFSTVMLVVVLAVFAAGPAWNLHRNPEPKLVGAGLDVTPWTGPVPGTHPDLVRDSLADLRALVLPGGAAVAGPHGPWRYVWPRDASFVAAALCAAGEYDEGVRVLAFLDRVRPSSGRWAARYQPQVPPDGDAAYRDRDDQLDGSGWVPWATWLCASSGGDRAWLTAFWPMVRASAEQIVAEQRPDGLPAVSPDYWERGESEVTLGNAAPLLLGLRSAAGIATMLGQHQYADRWRAAADRLGPAIDRHFEGYPRTRGGGADAIVTLLGPPFAPPRAEVAAAIERSRRVLTVPNGGVTPGQDWRADGVAWTPQTALFGLSAAARGDRAAAVATLDWLAAHRTPRGDLPEKVTRTGRLAGEAPLAWTSALVVLTAVALDRPLPIP